MSGDFEMNMRDSQCDCQHLDFADQFRHPMEEEIWLALLDEDAKPVPNGEDSGWPYVVDARKGGHWRFDRRTVRQHQQVNRTVECKNAGVFQNADLVPLIGWKQTDIRDEQN